MISSTHCYHFLSNVQSNYVYPPDDDMSYTRYFWRLASCKKYIKSTSQNLLHTNIIKKDKNFVASGQVKPILKKGLKRSEVNEYFSHDENKLSGSGSNNAT